MINNLFSHDLLWDIAPFNDQACWICCTEKTWEFQARSQPSLRGGVSRGCVRDPSDRRGVVRGWHPQTLLC